MKFENLSTWQRMALKELFTAVGLAITSATLIFFVTYASLTSFASFDINNVFAGWSKLRVFVVLALLFAVLTLSIVYWRLYRYSYDLKERPIDTVDNFFKEPTALFNWKNDKGIRDDAENIDNLVSCYVRQFFLDAIVRPRYVFTRISEHIYPESSMVSCRADYEIGTNCNYGLNIYGLNDYGVKRANSDDSNTNNVNCSSCNLLVPVAFQKRGTLSIDQQIFDAGERRLPIVSQREVVEFTIKLIELYFNNCDSRIDENLYEQLRKYLFNVHPNKDIQVPQKVIDEMVSLAGEDEDKLRFCHVLLKALVGLRDVIPVCVSVHMVAMLEKGPSANCSIKRIFKLRVEEKRELKIKPSDAISGTGRIRKILNRIIRVPKKSGGTVYYSLARASRTDSYHLYLEGPEGTYYTQGSIIRINPKDKISVIAQHIEMQSRRGQRNAHVYIRSGRHMSNAAFMFNYKKAPLDTYHIMFVALLLCTASLIMCAMGMLASINSGKNNGVSNTTFLSLATMLLPVVTACGTWIYGRASDGRENTPSVAISAVLMTACSVIGMVFHTLVVLGNIGNIAAIGVWAWTVLISVMGIDTAYIGYTAFLHTWLHSSLCRSETRGGTNQATEIKPISLHHIAHEARELVVDNLNGIRFDTPQGCYVTNDYYLLRNTIIEFENLCDLKIESMDKEADCDRRQSRAKR